MAILDIRAIAVYLDTVDIQVPEFLDIQDTQVAELADIQVIPVAELADIPVQEHQVIQDIAVVPDHQAHLALVDFQESQDFQVQAVAHQ